METSSHQQLDLTLGIMRDPDSVIDLGYGGAHYGLICDGSYPTTLLTHWTRTARANASR